MIIQILSYFSILLTFTLLIYWPFINHFKQNEFIHRTKPYVTGIKFGVAGLILTIAAVQLVHGLMINSRIILLLFSGLLGGPISLLISGIIMGVGKTFINTFGFVLLRCQLFYLLDYV